MTYGTDGVCVIMGWFSVKQNEVTWVLEAEIPVLWSHDWWHMRIRSNTYGYEQSCCCAQRRARRLSDRAEVVANTNDSMAEWTYCLHDLKLHNPPQQGEHKQNTNSFVTSILCTQTLINTHITNAQHTTELRRYSDITKPQKCFLLFQETYWNCWLLSL